MDTVLMPGTGFVEMALAAARQVGAYGLEELTLEVPLLLWEQGAVQLQLSVSESDERGCCQFAIYSRPWSSSSQEEIERESWTRHATGVLGGEDPAAGALADPRLQELAAQPWPPQGAEELETESFYDRMAEAGVHYGPVFQGMRRAWRLGDSIYSEIALEEEQGQSDFLLHPGLLDAALHALMLAADDSLSGGPQIPFSYADMRLHGQGGASSMRIALNVQRDSNGASTLSLSALDGDGEPLLTIERLQLRTVDQSVLQASKHKSNEALYELQWQQLPLPTLNGNAPTIITLQDNHKDTTSRGSNGSELVCYPDLATLTDAIEGGTPTPQIVLVRASSLAPQADPELTGTVLAQSIHALSERVLGLLQDFLAADCLVESKLVLVTDNALSVSEQEAPGLEQASLAGLLRSAHSEHPERFSLIDVDGSDASRAVLVGALLSEERELAIRQGSLYAPRLARMQAAQLEERVALELDPGGTVLVTGGTGGLGALLARHLVEEHQARHLLLVSRSGERAEGVKELRAQLEELGCEVQIVACDVSDRAALEGVINGISPEHPLSVVVHAAGVLDDGVIESLDGERLRGVMTPKIDAAINLHELTAGLALSEMILFSSFAGIMGSPRRASYAAANTFLDALAAHRRAQGLPAISLAFGVWERVTGMTGDAERARSMESLRRSEGLLPISDEQGLELIDTARSTDQALLVPVRLDSAALRSLAKAGVLPTVLQGLVRVSARRASDARDSLAKKLAQAPESEWEVIVLELVKGHVADVLGHVSSKEINPQRPFKELGFDSLAAIELRNRLSQATNLKLPSTLTFDHPTPAIVVQYLCSRVGVHEAPRPAIDEMLQQLEGLLATVAENEVARKQVDPRLRSFNESLRAFLSGAGNGDMGGSDQDADQDLSTASDAELMAIIEKEIGAES
jgi:NAD(P)-dependent dehydrogenase (short-subunit alcohol dehydrogenase family)/acyl carrier protein